MAEPLLVRAEQIFGPRDNSMPYLGVAYRDDGPIIWYEPSFSGVRTALNTACVEPNYYPDQMLFQLAHEVIHLLDLNTDPPTTMLEEGLAVWFSINAPTYWDDEHSQNVHNRLVEDQNGNYGIAYRAYQNLIALEPWAVASIRMRGCTLGQVRPDILKRLFPMIGDELATLLSDRRQMR